MDCEDLYINSVSRILWPVILLSFILKSEEQIKGEQTKAAMNFELIWMWSWLATIQRAQNPSLNTLKFSTGSSWIWVSWFTCIFTCIHVRDKSSFKLSPSQKHRAASPLCNPAELRDDTGCPSSWTPGFSPSAKSLLLTDNCLPSSSERTTSSMTRFTGTTTSKKKKKYSQWGKYAGLLQPSHSFRCSFLLRHLLVDVKTLSTFGKGSELWNLQHL